MAAETSRLADLVAAARDDVERAFPDLSELRSEVLADLLAAHRFGRDRAIEGETGGCDLLHSATALLSWLTAVED